MESNLSLYIIGMIILLTSVIKYDNIIARGDRYDERQKVLRKRQEIVFKLTKARIEKGLSQAQLAELVDKQNISYANW